MANEEVLQPAAAADVVDSGDAGVSGGSGGGGTFDDIFDQMKTDSMAKKLVSTDWDNEKLEKLMYKPEVTDEDRKEAKADLADEVSDLIPEEDRKNLIKAQEAIIDGDPKKLAEVFQAYANDPEKLAKIVKELDRNLSRDHAGTHLAINKAGNVYLYNSTGDMAMEFSPKDGSVGLRSIKTNFGGSVVLLPGEVVGADVGKVATAIGDNATRHINANFIKIGVLHGAGRTVGAALGAAAEAAVGAKPGAKPAQGEVLVPPSNAPR